MFVEIVCESCEASCLKRIHWPMRLLYYIQKKVADIVMKVAGSIWNFFNVWAGNGFKEIKLKYLAIGTITYI